jgi:hypothetical protein
MAKPRSATTVTATSKMTAAPPSRRRATKRRTPPPKPVVLLVGDAKALVPIKNAARYRTEPRVVNVAAATSGKRIRRPDRATTWVLLVNDADLGGVVNGIAGTLVRGDVVIRFAGAMPDALAAVVRAKRAAAGSAQPVVWWPAGGRTWFGSSTAFLVEGDKQVRAALKRMFRVPVNNLHTTSGFDHATFSALLALPLHSVQASVRAAAAVLGELFGGAIPASKRYAMLLEAARRSMWLAEFRTPQAAGAPPDDPAHAETLRTLAVVPEARALYRAALAALALPSP